MLVPINDLSEAKGKEVAIRFPTSCNRFSFYIFNFYEKNLIYKK